MTPMTARDGQHARNLRALRVERRSRCMWAAAKHGPVVAEFVKLGETEPFGACGLCEPIVRARPGYRQVDGPGEAA